MTSELALLGYPARDLLLQPAFVAHTAACLAQVHGVTVEVMAARTTRNARELFGIA